MTTFAIISRPAQFYTVLNVVSIDVAETIFIVVDNSNCTGELVQLISLSEQRCKDVHVVSNIYKALKLVIKYNSNKSYVLTYTDRGFRINYYFFLLRKSIIDLYEDGAAPYFRQDKFSSLYKKIFYKMTVCKALFSESYLGCSRFVDKIHIQYPDAHKRIFPNCRKEILPLGAHPLDYLQKSSHYEKVIAESLKKNSFLKKNVILFLGGYTLNPDFQNQFHLYHDHVKVLKPHPESEYPLCCLDDYDHIAPTCLLSEALILYLLNLSKNLVIVHECSASLIPFVTDSYQFEQIKIAPSADYAQEYSNVISEIIASKAKISTQFMT
jgi:hypothetical protein